MVIGVTESCIKRNVKSFINILQHNHDILDVNEIRRSHKQQIFVRDDNKKKTQQETPKALNGKVVVIYTTPCLYSQNKKTLTE